MDIPNNIDLPVSEPNEQEISRCMKISADNHGVPELFLRIIRDIENGKVGTLKRNSNDTYDMGVMQINSINLKSINATYQNVGWFELATDACVSIDVAAWFIKKKLKKASKTNPLVALMDYHSSTPEVRIHYAFKVMQKFNEYQTNDGTLFREALSYKFSD